MTEYMIGKGPGAGVQHKKEGPIMEDDQPADLDSLLDRIAPEKREAFQHYFMTKQLNSAK